MSTTFKKRSRPSGQHRRVKRDESEANGEGREDDDREEDREEETIQIMKPQIRTISSKTIQSTKSIHEEKSLKERGSEGQEEVTPALAYSSTREIVPKKYAGDATHTIEIDTATDRSVDIAPPPLLLITVIITILLEMLEQF